MRVRWPGPTIETRKKGTIPVTRGSHLSARIWCDSSGSDTSMVTSTQSKHATLGEASPTKPESCRVQRNDGYGADGRIEDGSPAEAREPRIVPENGSCNGAVERDHGDAEQGEPGHNKHASR
jgi:hypothetical protein